MTGTLHPPAAEVNGNPVPPDARDGRTGRFLRQFARPRFAIPGILIVALAIGLVTDSASATSVVAVLVIGFVILIRRAWGRADQETRDAFFYAYAESRELEDPGLEEIPFVTSLLLSGDHRQSGRIMSGVLDGQWPGLLAHFVYQTVAGKDNSERVIFHDFTVALFELPGASQQIGELHFLARSREDRLTDDHPIPPGDPLVFESNALNSRYSMQVSTGSDPILTRQIFSPSFIVWLSEFPPVGFGFELEGDWLCCYATELIESAAGLDEFAAASASVAVKLADKAIQASSRI